MKNSVYFVFMILCVGLISAEEDVKEKSKDPFVETFHSLKQEEKNDFLRYFLAVGLKTWIANQPRAPKFSTHQGNELINSLNISKETTDKFEKMNIPKESGTKLLEWTKKEFKLSTRDILDLLRNNSCALPYKTCLPDVGELCCPW